MNKDLIKDALEIGLNYVLESGWTRHRAEEVALIEKAILELDKPKPYYPLGQEPIPETCLSCTLQCPTDCPLDKQN